MPMWSYKHHITPFFLKCEEGGLNLWLALSATTAIRKEKKTQNNVYVKTKQYRERPGRALPAFSGKDIAAFVSKQNNKTSQPVVVNFLFASIDSISFFFFLLPLETAAATLQVKASGRKKREKKIERGGKERDRVPAAEKQLRT